MFLLNARNEPHGYVGLQMVNDADRFSISTIFVLFESEIVR